MMTVESPFRRWNRIHPPRLARGRRGRGRGRGPWIGWTTFASLFLPVLLAFTLMVEVTAQNYEVADIDCAIGTNGRELLSARLRRPEGFRGVPIFADDTSGGGGVVPDSGFDLDDRLLHQDLTHANAHTYAHMHAHGGRGAESNSLIKDPPCQIFPDPTDSSGRVFVLRVSDFSQCGVLKRNGFIHVRIWFPQLPGVVMLSDQEVIIMCKPPSPTITQSKTAGFAGSIPNGARVSGIVEESPGRLEYEVALFRETSGAGGGNGNGGAGRGLPPGSERDSANALAGGATYVTGINAQELPVDQAVPIGTRLQLRAKISPDSVWQHAKLMEVSVSPDPKNPTADGSVALVKDGCRNPELASIIPKQPYRFKERTNEVVLDFEAFLLSNMGDRSTLWLHTQIKACMEAQDCTAQFCPDVYQPSGFGRRRRRRRSVSGPTMTTTTQTGGNGTGSFGLEYASPLSQHWKTILDNHARKVQANVSEMEIETQRDTQPQMQQVRVTSKKVPLSTSADGAGAAAGVGGSSTQFDENIGFSVMMPADYYRSIKMNSSHSTECSSWILSTMGLCFALALATVLTCILSYRLQRSGGGKGKDPFYQSNASPATKPQTPTRAATPSMSSIGGTGISITSVSSHTSECKGTTATGGSHSHSHTSVGHHHHHHHRRSGANSGSSGPHSHGGAGGTVACKISSSKYARDTSLYRP